MAENHQNKAIEVTEATTMLETTEIVCEFYAQSMYSYKVSRICTHHLCRSLNHHHIRDFAFNFFRSISPCDSLRNSFILLLQLLKEPKI
ncbi:MAG: hypothetical protein HXO38_09715 [Prevotella sp.]|uniref:hypothetical protein n=1 Tax=Prevotella sp. TaxID=59823 RepID=UPI001CAE3752|nr:hypothetical protein [Prevotella sp.]MBF1610094.1 hypothetical protein [Prevotella sp.]